MTLTDYKPRNDIDKTTAITAIKRAFEEQPIECRPIEISFDSDAFRIINTRYIPGPGFNRVPSGSFPVTIYYDSLGNSDCYRRHKEFKYGVRIRNKHGDALKHLYFYDEVAAKNFLDALESLRTQQTHLKEQIKTLGQP